MLDIQDTQLLVISLTFMIIILDRALQRVCRQSAEKLERHSQVI